MAELRLKPFPKPKLVRTKPLALPEPKFLLWLLSKTDTGNLTQFCNELDIDQGWFKGVVHKKHTAETVRKHIEVARAAGVSLDEYFERFLATE